MSEVLSEAATPTTWGKYESSGDRDQQIRNAMRTFIESMEAERAAAFSDGNKVKACNLVRHRTSDRAAGAHGVKDINVYEDSVIGYLNTVKNGIMSAVTPEDQTWFRITTYGVQSATLFKERVKKQVAKQSSEYFAEAATQGWSPDITLLEEIPGALDWFEYAAHRCLTNYAMKGFYRELADCITDGLVMGYGIFGTIDDIEHDKQVYYKSISPFECAFRKNDHGEVECFSRRYAMTSYDIWSLYGEKSPEYVLEHMKNGETSIPLQCLELVVPQGAMYDPATGGKLTIGTQKFIRLVWCEEADAFLEKRSIEEMPYSVFIWQEAGGHRYGRGLVECNVDDIVALYHTKSSLMDSTEYNINPAYDVPLSFNTKFSARPGARNYFPSTVDGSTEKLVERPNVFNELTALMQDQRANIRENMMVDIFKTILGGTDSRKTAYEINIRKSEAAQMLTMAIGNEATMLDYVFRRTMHLMIKNEQLPVASPQIDAILPYTRMQFDSVFIQRMKAYYQVDGNTSILSYITQVYQIYPDISCVIDFEQLTRMVTVGLGTSQYAVYDKEKTRQLLEQKAQMAQQQLQLQQNQMQSEANRNNAQAQQYMGGMASGQ